MPAMAILGPWGSGKTLTLTYEGVKYLLTKRICANPECRELQTINEIKRNGGKCFFCGYDKFKVPVVYANYHLKIPYVHIAEVEDIEKMRDGVFLADEFYRWLNARVSMSKKNRVLSKMMMNMRKWNVNLIYTAQTWRQIDVWIKSVTDYVAFPQIIGHKKELCYVYIFSTPPSPATYIKTIVYRTHPFFKLYYHRESIPEIELPEQKNDIEIKEYKTTRIKLNPEIKKILEKRKNASKKTIEEDTEG